MLNDLAEAMKALDGKKSVLSTVCNQKRTDWIDTHLFVCLFLVCFVFDGIAHWTVYWSNTSAFEAIDG